MNHILRLQEKFKKLPLGNWLFSKAMARQAPYFTTIKPKILELRHNYMKVSMPKRKAVQNHLQTVHAIAMCNLCEFAGGICMEASIPKHRRWIPIGMTVAAICDLSEVDWENCNEVICAIKVKDTAGTVVMTGDITMKVSDKPKR